VSAILKKWQFAAIGGGRDSDKLLPYLKGAHFPVNRRCSARGKYRLPSDRLLNDLIKHFFRSVEREWTNEDRFASIREARPSMRRYLETFYNTEGIHEALGYQTPNDFEG